MLGGNNCDTPGFAKKKKKKHLVREITQKQTVISSKTMDKIMDKIIDIQHLYHLDSRKRKYYLSVFAHIPLYSEQIISGGGGNPVTMCNGFHLKFCEVCKGHPVPKSQLKSREKALLLGLIGVDPS